MALPLTACVEPSQRSAITESIDQVSFAPPPSRAPREIGFLPPTAQQPSAALPGAQIFPPSRARPPARPGAPPAAERSEEGVQLNFDRADIREVVRVILGDMLGATYTIDPNVSGEVTLSSSAPLAEPALLAVLESALRASGAALVGTGAGTYQILPAEAAIGGSEVVPLGGRAVRVRPGYGITVVPLRNISATAAAQFIQPLVATPEDIRIDPGRNAILFTGTAAERQNVVEMLADLDAEWMANKPIGLFPLRMTTPEAVIPELQAIFGPFDPTGAEPSMIRFLPIARMNAVLAVGGDPDQMTEVEGWVRRLDQGQTVGMQFYVYYLKHAGAEDIAKLLNESFGGGGGSASAGLGPAAATTAFGAVQPVPAVDEGIEPAPPEGGIPPSPPAVGGGEQAGAGGVKVVANKANNALLIRATPQDYEMVEATLRRLDTAPWQVLIEATIAEVALNDLLRYGVQYFIEGNNFGIGFNTFDDQSLDPRPVDPGFNFLFTGGGASITIDALSRLTDVKVLSSPSVVVLDNSEAVLTVGDEVPITTRQAASTEDITTSLNTIEYRDTGVILQVRPRINTNEVVSLEIAQEVSRVAGAATELTPVITQRKITSRVNVQSGQTVVLGGLIQESEDRGRDRVPILGEIPVVGSLFSATRNEARRTELIVFITPRVIRNPQDARDVSEEIRDRLKALRPPQVSVAPPMPNVVPTAPRPPARPQPLPPAALPPAAMIPPRLPPDARPGPRPAAGPTPLTRPAAAAAATAR